MNERDARRHVARLRARLLPKDLKVEVVLSKAPGGDAENVAHVHSLPILDDFLIEWNPDFGDSEILLALTHEVLHIAFRHVASAVDAVKENQPLLGSLLERALEEDTEALARRLVVK